MTNTGLDQVQRPIVQKAADREGGWEVIGADGEVLERTTTKRAANKLADQDERAQKEALVRRARQEADERWTRELNSPTSQLSKVTSKRRSS